MQIESATKFIVGVDLLCAFSMEFNQSYIQQILLQFKPHGIYTTYLVCGVYIQFDIFYNHMQCICDNNNKIKNKWKKRRFHVRVELNIHKINKTFRFMRERTNNTFILIHSAYIFIHDSLNYTHWIQPQANSTSKNYIIEQRVAGFSLMSSISPLCISLLLMARKVFSLRFSSHSGSGLFQSAGGSVRFVHTLLP